VQLESQRVIRKCGRYHNQFASVSFSLFYSLLSGHTSSVEISEPSLNFSTHLEKLTPVSAVHRRYPQKESMTNLPFAPGLLRLTVRGCISGKGN
jgi:hypothetical protein